MPIIQRNTPKINNNNPPKPFEKKEFPKIQQKPQLDDGKNMIRQQNAANFLNKQPQQKPKPILQIQANPAKIEKNRPISAQQSPLNKIEKKNFQVNSKANNINNRNKEKKPGTPLSNKNPSNKAIKQRVFSSDPKENQKMNNINNNKLNKNVANPPVVNKNKDNNLAVKKPPTPPRQNIPFKNKENPKFIIPKEVQKNEIIKPNPKDPPKSDEFKQMVVDNNKANNVISKEKPKEISKFKEIPKEKLKEISKELPKDISKELPKEVSKELSKELMKDIPKENNKIIQKEAIKQNSKEKPKENLEVAKDLQKSTSKETHKEISKEISKEPPKVISQNNLKELPKDVLTKPDGPDGRPDEINKVEEEKNINSVFPRKVSVMS